MRGVEMEPSLSWSLNEYCSAPGVNSYRVSPQCPLVCLMASRVTPAVSALNVPGMSRECLVNCLPARRGNFLFVSDRYLAIIRRTFVVSTARASYSPRLSRHDAALIPYAMQPRDERAQEVLAIYRCMTAPMIASAIQEPVQSVRNRLQHMFKHGVCRRYQVGIRHLVYTPHWLSRGQNPYLLHDLMAAQFRLTLELEIRLCPDWGYAWKPSWDLRAEKGEVVPDAELVLFRLQGDKRAEVFVRCEFDRATESPSRVAAQCERYLAWRQEQRKTNPESRPFYVAWITTSAQRVATLRAEIRRRIGTARMFLFTHEGRYAPAHPAMILGPLWQGLGEDQERPLLA
jgi:hypothetical protein